MTAPMRRACAASLAAPAALLLAAGPAGASVVRDCDTPLASARNLARPYAAATRDFANGDVSVLLLILDEPACCGAHLMVLFPEVEGYRACRLVTTDDGAGFASLDLPGATASYDPSRGLTVTLPGAVWNGEGFAPVALDVTVNQAEGAVAARER